MKKEATVVKFAISLNIRLEDEIVYINDGSIPKSHDYEELIPDYFNKEKIVEMKQKICKQIMESENPFTIHESDIDQYEVEESKIWEK